MVLNRFAVINVVIGLFLILIVYILGKYFKSKKIKYIPAIITFIAGIACIIKSVYFSQGFEDIAYMILAFIIGVGFMASLLTALFIDYICKKNIEK